MLRAKDIANYFLARVDDDAGEGITNLKLQKLVYYAQGAYLALYNEPLFEDPIEAWAHGPVVPSLYHAYKEHGTRPIPPPARFSINKYERAVREVLDEVYKVFGQFSAWKLRNMTHEEPPWKNTAQGGVITHALLHKYFKTIVKNG